MEIEVKDKDDVKVIAFSGELDSTNAAEVDKELNEIISDGSDNIVINFGDLEYISSAGLRILLGIAKSLKADGGSLKLCNLNDVVQEVFDISGFSTIFDLYSTEEEALGSL